MDHKPIEYRKLALVQYPALGLKETAEGRYWKRFGGAVNAQQVKLLLRLRRLHKAKSKHRTLQD